MENLCLLKSGINRPLISSATYMAILCSYLCLSMTTSSLIHVIFIGSLSIMNTYHMQHSPCSNMYPRMTPWIGIWRILQMSSSVTNVSPIDRWKLFISFFHLLINAIIIMLCICTWNHPLTYSSSDAWRSILSTLLSFPHSYIIYD